MLDVSRREEKYSLHLSEALLLSNKLSQVLTPDENSKEGAYLVRTLYFDTIEDRDFFDKINEQYLRRKIRIRCYSTDDKIVKLEMKQKQGVYQKKRSMYITREDALRLIDGQYSVLLRYNDDFAAELFSVMTKECYRPKSIIEYSRSAFVVAENNTRLTIDSRIYATESSHDFFERNLQLYPILEQDRAILEIKYNRFLLGYISDLLSCVNRKTVSYSKYTLSRSLGYPLYR